MRTILILALILAALLTAQVIVTPTGVQVTLLQVGTGLIAVSTPNQPPTVSVDQSIVAIWVGPPTAWPAPAGWCKSSGQIAADDVYLYRCATLSNGTMEPRRFGITGGWQR